MKPSILVVDDQRGWQLRAKMVLGDGYDVEVAESYSAAIDKLNTKRPPYHVLIADIRLNDGDPEDTSGLRVVKYARDLGGYTAVIIWTAYPEIDTAKTAFRDLDAVDYVEKSFELDDDEFRGLVEKAATGATQKRWPRQVLLVDADGVWREKISRLLEQAECSAISVDNFTHALDLATRGEFRLIVVDIALEDGLVKKGLNFIQQIREASPESKIVVVSDGGTRADMRYAFVNLHVLDYIIKSDDGAYDPGAILKIAEEVYRPSNQLYIVAELRDTGSNYVLEIGKEYALVISARERVIRLDQSTVPIWLPPWKNRVEVEVVLDLGTCEGCVGVKPATTQIWMVSRGASSISFTIVPTEPGPCNPQVELFGEGNWWRRIPLQTFVVQ